jgi:hypothetical protein
MISFYGGRLILDHNRDTRCWQVEIRLSPLADHQASINTGERDLHKAMEHGMTCYRKMRADLASLNVVMCWDCLHWEPPGKGRCSLNIPEARKTGGKFAAGCALYTPCPGLK